MYRARHVAAQHHQLGHFHRIERAAVDAAVGADGADAGQHLRPGEVVEPARVRIAAGAQQVELDVEDAGCVVAALEEGAELKEIVGLVAQQGDLRCTEDHHRLLHHQFDQGAAVENGAIAAQARAEFQPQPVQALPDVDGEVVAFLARVAARRADRTHDRGWVVLVEDEKVDEAGKSMALLLDLPELVFHAEDRGNAGSLLAARLQRHALRRLDEARRRLGALQIAAHPVEILGGAAQHGESIRPRRLPGRVPTCPWSHRPGSN